MDFYTHYRSRVLARESYAASAAVDEARYGFSRRLSVSARNSEWLVMP